MTLDAFSPDQDVLVDGTELSEVKGVLCSDIVIRHALILGLQDLRDHPWQLQLVFASLIDDPYTVDKYGKKELDKAVAWFLKTNIPVVMDYNLPSSPAMPCITVGLQESNEADATVGDVHYVPNQSTPAVWEPIGSKFSATYDPETGLVTPNSTVAVNTQMLFVDGAGTSHPIVRTMVNSEGVDVFYIATGLVINTNKCYLKWSTNKLSVQLESCNFKETYTVGCHVKGETSYLLYLWAIVVYSLMRYKKTLIEGRGFERSVISSTRIMKNSFFPEGTENVWTRFVNISGYSRMYWATQPSEKVTQAAFATVTDSEGLKASQVGFEPASFTSEPDNEGPTWMSGDGIGVRIV